MNVIELRGVSKLYGNVRAVENLSFAVPQGQVVSLLGPSGCGKTTTLRLIAGFETPDSGTLLLAGKDMRRRRPYERNVGLLFQDYALFPHMTVAENVAYGLRRRGFDRADIRSRVTLWLERTRLQGLEDRRPGQLSGGQQQRVALARALATDPAAVLLDEPLSALDAKLRQELRVELKELLTSVGSTTIVVTHDQEEAMSLSERIIVMNGGRIMQAGTPREIYDRPRSKFVAEFIGRSNWFTGELGAATGSGMREFRAATGEVLRVPDPTAADGRGWDLGVRPERIEIMRSGAVSPAGEAWNSLSGIIRFVAHLGADMHILIGLPGGASLTVVAKYAGGEIPSQGESVGLRFRCRDCIVVPAEQEGEGALPP